MSPRTIVTALAALLTLLLPIATAAADGPGDLARHGLREALTREQFYFVMADRFANGTTANDRGGLADDRLVSGFDPASRGFYHGGDLQGLRERLDYIKGLGTTAVWLTPSFKNRPVQGTGENVSAGYHGYWITDFEQIDPHLGTNEELTRLIDAAHAKGMKVFFDVITNHTADVIDYREKAYEYIPKAQKPYRDAAGRAFDDRDFAGRDGFPALDPLVSFPRTPFFNSEADATVKNPAWLNDPTMYHNRGDSTFAGESSLYGDFAGLDDLFTERREVVDGMIDIYRFWVREFGVDGFRIDTVKHVNTEFWQRFVPAILDEAHRAGKDEFFMFGEVFDTSRPFLSSFTTRARLQSVLDFAFQRGAQDFAAGSAPTDRLRDLFLGDDWFTDRDSNAYQLPTFLGNHDMGRIGFFTARDNPGAADDELLARDRLAHELMFFSRGMPVVYYGDEQGFTGGGQGNDQLARQDMFPSLTQEYWDDDSIGTDATPQDDNFDPAHPLYRAIGSLADLTKAHPALRDGAQQHRWSSPAAGIYAFSRTRAREQVEYVVALNNAEEERSAAVPTSSAGMAFARLHGQGPQALTSGADRTLALTVPPLSAVVYRAEDRTSRSRRAPRIVFAAPAPGAEVTRRAELRADLAGSDFAEVTFAARERGSGGWRRLGTDDNAPYRVFADLSRYDAGTRLELLAVVRDNAGHSRSTRRTVRVGDAGAPLAPAVVHYLRSDGDYTDWGLHLFGDAIAEGLGTSWEAPRPPDGIDADGAFWRLGLKDEEASVNFIVHTPSGDEVPLTREPGGDRSFVPAETREIWLRQGDPNVYTARPPAG